MPVMVVYLISRRGKKAYVAAQGVNPNSGNGVYQGVASVSVPVFHGRRTNADEDQARAINQRRAEYQDQRGDRI